MLNKYPDRVPEESAIVILNRNYDVCMDKYGKDNKHIRHISRRVHFVRNGENYKMHKIHWRKGVLELSEIATNNDDKNNSNPIMRYITVRLYS